MKQKLIMNEGKYDYKRNWEYVFLSKLDTTLQYLSK